MLFTDKVEADKLKHDNLIRHAKDKKHREKKRRIREYMDKVGHSISKKEERLKEKQGELLQLRQKHISDLTLYIFDISEVKQKRYALYYLKCITYTVEKANKTISYPFIPKETTCTEQYLLYC